MLLHIAESALATKSDFDRLRANFKMRTKGVIFANFTISLRGLAKKPQTKKFSRVFNNFRTSLARGMGNNIDPYIILIPRCGVLKSRVGPEINHWIVKCQEMLLSNRKL